MGVLVLVLVLDFTHPRLRLRPRPRPNSWCCGQREREKEPAPEPEPEPGPEVSIAHTVTFPVRLFPPHHNFISSQIALHHQWYNTHTTTYLLPSSHPPILPMLPCSQCSMPRALSVPRATGHWALGRPLRISKPGSSLWHWQLCSP